MAGERKSDSRGRSATNQPELLVGLNAVIIAVTRDQPRVLTVGPQSATLGAATEDLPITYRALPFGPFDREHDRTLELCMRETVKSQTGLELGYVEQLYTFADMGRDPREASGGSRVMSVAYLALLHESDLSAGDDATWENCYEFFPWEDWRGGKPLLIDEIAAGLEDWAASSGSTADETETRERIDICFGLGEAGWDAYQVLERYELLYEARLVAEYWLDRSQEPSPGAASFGRPMAFDHRRILATGLSRVRGKLRYRPVAFELIPETFTLLRLQHAVEAISGLRSHKQNFRRLIEKSGLVEGTGEIEAKTGGRPAELFRFRRAVLSERRAPGVATLAPPRAR
ncbi:MAG TPA: hypothetical protein VIV14_08155 [Gammaproteobacteria bacterium]